MLINDEESMSRLVWVVSKMHVEALNKARQTLLLLHCGQYSVPFELKYGRPICNYCPIKNFKWTSDP